MGLLQSYLHLSSHTEAQRYLEFVELAGTDPAWAQLPQIQ